MFSVNSYAKIKEVEDKGNYSVCKISTFFSNKHKKNQLFLCLLIINIILAVFSPRK